MSDDATVYCFRKGTSCGQQLEAAKSKLLVYHNICRKNNLFDQNKKNMTLIKVPL